MTKATRPPVPGPQFPNPGAIRVVRFERRADPGPRRGCYRLHFKPRNHLNAHPAPLSRFSSPGLNRFFFWHDLCVAEWINKKNPARGRVKWAACFRSDPDPSPSIWDTSGAHSRECGGRGYYPTWVYRTGFRIARDRPNATVPKLSPNQTARALVKPSNAYRAFVPLPDRHNSVPVHHAFDNPGLV